ncbi:hypothetical protein [Pseudoalteromonas sp. SWN166]|uniref:hypothetical protein n=1 Tax=Pseudoalteromonas sp. SWN166 TaxID=2792061 RepID=UPI0018CF2DC8|nr:hypothetical protein [Pseudoalteromonas sp. SWN166]MBH0037758.1 hypothetical protein [Pseudoalteromonas sp. SWN166]
MLATEETNLTDLISLLNYGVTIQLELASGYISIDDKDFPPYEASNGIIYLIGKARDDFDMLCEKQAIGGVNLDKPYLVGLCLWDTNLHGIQSGEGILLAKKFGIGKEFIDDLVVLDYAVVN